MIAIKALNERLLLQVWEACERMHPLDRALEILRAACPQADWQELAELTVGQRDALLLRLRQMCSGELLEGVSACPQCETNVEFQFAAPQLLALADDAHVGKEFEQRLAGCNVRFRLPNSLDLAAAVQMPDAKSGRERLLERCVLNVQCNGQTMPLDSLSDDSLDELGGWMDQLDPLANMRIHLRCPECSHEWTVGFDILAFLWTEILQRAHCLMGEVHLLASAYGWSEQAIQEMSPVRRHAYLQRIT